MIPRDLVVTTAWCVAIGISALGFGSFLIDRLARLLPDDEVEGWSVLEYLGLSLLVGLGGLGSLATVAAGLGLLNRATLVTIGIAAAVTSLPHAPRQLRRTRAWVVAGWRRPGLFVGLCIAFAAVIAGSLYLSAMLLPYATDELSYHFPQAEIVVRSGKLVMPLGGHPYYGNIPKLMEMVFAAGISLGGYSLAHALHLAFAIGFIGFVGGYTTRLFGARAGALAVVLTLLYHDYTWNATVGFVDAGASSAEVAALLLAVDWFVSGRGRSLTTAGALIGIAVGIKYTPLPTALFIVALLVARGVGHPAKIARPLLAFGAVALLFGGGWYARNLIALGNPVYPLYFGHAGINEADFQSILADLHQFGPRTLTGLLGTPLRFIAIGAFVPAAALVLAPLAAFGYPQRNLRLALLAYAVCYTVYWFFIATHQLRFLMSAMLVSLLLSAIVLSSVRSTPFWMAATVLMCWLGATQLRSGAAGLLYGAGRLSRSEILRRQLGCQLEAIEFLESNRLAGAVIDNWSIWHAPNVAFYARKNTLQRLSVPDTAAAALANAIRAGGIRYIFLDTAVKARHLANPDPQVALGRSQRAATEARLLQVSRPVFAVDACRLYQIDTTRLAAGAYAR